GRSRFPGSPRADAPGGRWPSSFSAVTPRRTGEPGRHLHGAAHDRSEPRNPVRADRRASARPRRPSPDGPARPDQDRGRRGSADHGRPRDRGSVRRLPSRDALMKRAAYLAYGGAAYAAFIATLLYAIAFVGGASVPRTVDGGGAAIAPFS